ncbi:hypothetical protein KIPB_004685 [Kipferlia bialata]|uniref:Guanylate cyclase domain-containing protein n=1 Tax=Kipferlia bialata TaxID=797122 RepID=A0A9K3CVG1_9EUKA|nr:hypothetical protein KIPB_004685 [Kipferlia bialata]|eukprot:g4685.t1
MMRFTMEDGSTLRMREYNDMTILFADIVDFTTWCTRVSSQEMVQTLHRFNRAVFLLCGDRIKLAKSLGDGVMLVSTHCQGALSMVKLALELQTTLREMRFPLRVRIGIDCGEAVSGVIGSVALGVDYWGDAVNLASRLEGQCTPERVLCSEAAFNYVQGHIMLEGKHTPVEKTVVAKGFDYVKAYELKP